MLLHCVPLRNICKSRYPTTILHIAAIVIFAQFLLIGITAPRTAYALKITLEESADHPKGVEIPAEKDLNPAEPVKSSAAAPAESTQAPPQTVSNPASAPTAPKAPAEEKLHGVFALWQPLQELFPLKNGTISSTITNLTSDHAWFVFFSRYNAAGNYYLEGGRSIGPLKDFNVKTQYNRQLQTTLTSNSMTEFSTKLFGVQLKQSRNTTRTSQGLNPTAPMSISDNRRFSANYALNKNVTLDYCNEENISRTLSDAPSKTQIRRNTAAIGWNINDRMKLKLSRSSTANRSHATGAVSKVVQLDTQLSYALIPELDLVLGNQIVSNRMSSAATGNEQHKSIRTLGLQYQMADGTKVGYNFVLTSDRYNAPGVYTDYNSVDREMLIQRAIFSWLEFTGRNKVGFSENSGKTAQREGTFSLKHQKLQFFPGDTRLQIRKNLNKTGDRNNPTSNVGVAYSLTNTLHYLNGNLTLNSQFNNDRNDLLAATGDQRNHTETNRYDVAWKALPSLTLNHSLTATLNTCEAAAGTTGRSKNKTTTDTISHLIKMPFTKKVSRINSLNLSQTMTRLTVQTDVPNPGRTETIVTKAAGLFNVADKGWTGNFGIEKSMNKPQQGAYLRGMQYRMAFNRENIHGWSVSAGMATATQKEGGINSGQFKVTGPAGVNSKLIFAYQYAKNQDYEERLENTFERTFMIGYECTK